MPNDYECPNCGYDMGSSDKACKYCGTKNPNYIEPVRPLFGSYRSDSGSNVSSKSKLACGLLQIFLGGLGIGRFYSGHTGIAIAQIIASAITFGLGSVWGFIDGIIILCTPNFKDASGNVMQ